MTRQAIFGETLPVLMTYKEAAQVLKVSVSTLRHWTMTDQITFCKLGPRAVRFRPSDLEAVLTPQGGVR